MDTLTNPIQVWPLSTEMKSVAHRIRFEGRVSFYDPRWHNSWLETDGVGTYVKLSPSPPLLRSGQRVRIEGTMVPLKGLADDTVKVTVLQDYEPIEPLATKGRIRDFNALGGRIVTLDGYVDGQQLMDDDHLRLALVVEDRPIIGWVKPDDPRSIPDWQGKFVRLVGLYSARYDPTATDTSIELWVGRQKDVGVLGALATEASFDQPRRRIGEIPQAPLGESVRIRGRVQTQQPGSFIVIRDETGQVEVQSLQEQRFPFDTEVDAVGRVALVGSRWILQSAMYRKTNAPAPANRASAESAAAIKTVGQVRELSP